MTSRLSSVAIIGSLTFLTLGCGAQSTGRVQEFRQLQSGSLQPIPGFVLRNLDRAFPNGGKPQYSAHVEPLTGTDASPELSRHVKVLLSGLTAQSCETVKKVYADGWKAGLSGVPCSEILAKQTRWGAVGIEHFLSPVMQATLKMTFDPESKETSNNPNNPTVVKGRYLETNCWATAFEVLRRTSGAAPQYSVHTVDFEYADKIFTSTNYMRLHAGPHNPTAVKGALLQAGREVKFGDLLVVRSVDDYGTPYIAHAAIFVDDGLLFERVGNEGRFPMRLSRFDDLAKLFADAKFEVRRPIADFPAVRSIPGVKFTRSENAEGVRYETEVIVKDLLLQKPADSLYKLPAEAFQRTRL